ncbi:MAG TPA: hypothetical protein PK819_10330, partial [Thermomicrobiales bacterium]|nr:hypothetical protein [Thermomicrobiales bacterium]
WAEVGVIAFALTPITIHFSRVQFGQTGSLFCVAAGLYAWARAREAGSTPWAIGSGLLLGASMYGGGAYYVAAPIFLFALIVGEVVARRTNFRGYRATLFGIIGFAITTIPIIYRASTDPAFLERMREKQGDQVNGLALSERISHVLDNYSKYFSFEYLFRVGETGMPGGFNLRHSVPGAGELSWIVLPLVLLGIVAIFRVKDEASRVFGVAGLVILILYPVPDALTSNLNDPPYSVTVWVTLIFIPLLAGLGMHWLTGIVVRRAQGREWAGALAALGILALVLLGGFRFWDGPYRDYPNVSAEYYGWQFGAGPSIALFEQHPGYDRYFLDGDFNAAFIFPHFYLADNPEMLAKTATGWPSYLSDSQHRDLYSIRADRYNALVQSNDIMRRYVKLIDIIRYPNGQIAMYLVEIGPTDQWPGRTVPR